jgi:hypothetical protein
LNETEVWWNHLVSSLRIRVEHTLSGVKRNRSVKEVLRNTKPGYSDLLMVTACGLHNWRMEYRHPLPTLNFLTLCNSPNFG